MYRLYDYLDSGNGYKVRLLLTQLTIPFEYVEKDIMKGETRSPDFLAINTNGRIPVLELEQNVYLSESNAILIYLSEETEFLPKDKLDRARVMQWLFFEQYSHEPFIATSRFWRRHGKAEQKQQALAEKEAPGYAALEVLEKRLANHPFLVSNRYTIADIALYAYTHVAPEGGFSLDKFPAVLDWCDRVSSQPNYISIAQLPSNPSKEEYLQEAKELWGVLKSLSDLFEKGTGDYEDRVGDVLAEIDKALRLDPNFPGALAFKVQLIADELGAHEEALEEAEHLVQVAPNVPQYQAMRAAIQAKLSGGGDEN